MNLDIEFRPYQKGKYQELVDFIRQYPRLPYGEAEFKLFVEELSSSPESVFDVWLDGRAALAVVSDRCSSLSGSTELGIFGFRWNLSGILFLDYILPKVATLCRKKNLSAIDVMSFTGARVSPTDLGSRGFKPVCQVLDFKTQAKPSEKPALALPTDYSWKELDADSIKTYETLIKTSFVNNPEAYFPDSELFQKRNLGSKIKPRLLLHKGEPVGFLRVAMSSTDKGDIILLGRKPDYKGKGLGEHLIREAMSLLEKNGAKTFTLSVNDGNTSAIKLYEKYGFQKKRQVGLFRYPIPAK